MSDATQDATAHIKNLWFLRRSFRPKMHKTCIDDIQLPQSRSCFRILRPTQLIINIYCVHQMDKALQEIKPTTPQIIVSYLSHSSYVVPTWFPKRGRMKCLTPCRFFLPNISNDVYKIVKACHGCARDWATKTQIEQLQPCPTGCVGAFAHTHASESFSKRWKETVSSLSWWTAI